jgi:hypothetical protein
MKRTIGIITALSVAGLVVGILPWHARRTAGKRYRDQGNALVVKSLTNCIYTEVKEVCSGIGGILGSGMRVLHRDAEPTAEQLELLAEAVARFMSHHAGSTSEGYPAYRLPGPIEAIQYDHLDPAFTDELLHPQAAFLIGRERVEWFEGRIDGASDTNNVLARIRLNHLIRTVIVSEAGGYPCTNCVQSVCVPSIRVSFAQSVTEETQAREMIREQPTHGSIQLFRQWHAVRPGPGEIIADQGSVTRAYVTFVARSGQSVLPLVLSYYWEPGRKTWILCEVGTGNTMNPVSFIL